MINVSLLSIASFMLPASFQLSSLLQLLIMAAFYNDSSRPRVFAERAQQYGPLNGPDMCPIDLLEWSPGNRLLFTKTSTSVKKKHPFPVLTCVSGNSTTTQQIIPTNAQALSSRAQPRVQIVYALRFWSTTLLMHLPFKLRPSGYCPPPVWSRHSSAI